MDTIDLAVLRVRFQGEDRSLQKTFDRSERRLNAFKAAGEAAGTVNLRVESKNFDRGMRGASQTVTRFKRQVAKGINVGLKTTGLPGVKKDLSSVTSAKKEAAGTTAVKITSSGAKRTIDDLSKVTDARKKASGTATVKMETEGAVGSAGAIKAVQGAANKLDRKKIGIVIGGAATIASAALTRQAIISVGERMDLLSNTARQLGAQAMPLMFGAAAGGTGVITALGTSTLALVQALGSGAAGFALIGGAAGAAAGGGLLAYKGAATAAVTGAINVRDNLLSLQQAALSSDQAVTAAQQSLKDAKPGTDAYAQAQSALSLATKESAKAHEDLRRVQILNTPAAQAFNAEVGRSQTALTRVQAELGKRVLPSFTRMMQVGRQTAPALTKPLYDLSKNVSLIGEEFVTTALKGQRLKQVQNVLNLVSGAGVKGAYILRNLGLSGLSAIQHLIDPANRLLGIMHRLSADAFDFTRSAQGARTMDIVVDRLEQRMYGLLRVAGNVGQGLSGIFSAFNEAGVTDRVFASLIRVSGGFARVGAEGSKSRQAIIDFSTQSEPVMRSIMGVVGEIGSEFGRLSMATIGFRAEGQKNTVLVNIFNAIRDSVRPVTDMMLQMFREVGPLVPDLIRNLGGLLNTFGGYTPVLASYLGGVNSLLSAFNKLPQPVKNNVANLVALSTIMKTSSGISIPGLVGGFVALRAQMGALSLASGKNIGVMGALKTSLFGVTGASTAAGTATAASATKMTLLQRAGVVGSAAMRGLGMAFRFMLGPWGLLIAGIAVGAVAIYKNWDKIKAGGQSLVSWAVPAFNSFKTTVGNAFRTVSQWAGPKLQQALGWARVQGQKFVGWWNQNLPLIKRTARVVFGGLMNTVGLPLKAAFMLGRRVFNAFVKDWNSGNSRVKNIIRATWRIVKNTVGTGIRIAGNLLKAGMQVLTGDWAGAWRSVKRIGQLAWNLLKSNVRNLVKIFGNVFRGFGNWISGWWKKLWSGIGNRWTRFSSNVKRSIVSWGVGIINWGLDWGRRLRGWWDGLWSGVSNRWGRFSSNVFSSVKRWTAGIRDWFRGFGENVGRIWGDLWSGVRDRWDSFSSKAGKAIKSWTSGIRDWIKGFGSNVVRIFTDKFTSAVNNVRSVLSFLAGAMQKVLNFIGADELAGKAKEVKTTLSEPIALAQGGVVENGKLQKMARGGIPVEMRPGGMAISPTVLYGEAGPEAYVRLDKKTPESQKAAQAVMRSPNAPMGPPEGASGPYPAPFARGGFFGPIVKMAGGGAADVANAVYEKFGVRGNPYGNLHGQYLPADVAARSIDFFPGRSGVPASGAAKTTGDKIAAFVAPPSSQYAIWYDQINQGGGWGPYNGGLGIGNPATIRHQDHVHTTAHSGSFEGGQGGGIGGAITAALAAGAKKLWDKLMPDMPDLGLGGFGKSIGSWFKDTLIGKAWEFVKSHLPIGGGQGGGPAGGSGDANRKIGKKMLEAAGMGGQWSALNNLWTKESQWDVHADNPTSDAYGIPQALPGSKMASSGPDWRDNASTQIDWGLGYIKERYGDPNAAWAHSQSVGWYEKGGRIPGRRGEAKPIMAHAGEIVLPAGVSDAFTRFGKSLDDFNRGQRLRTIQATRATRMRSHRTVDSGWNNYVEQARPGASGASASQPTSVSASRGPREPSVVAARNAPSAIASGSADMTRELARLTQKLGENAEGQKRMHPDDLADLAVAVSHITTSPLMGDRIRYELAETIRERRRLIEGKAAN